VTVHQAKKRKAPGLKGPGAFLGIKREITAAVFHFLIVWAEGQTSIAAKRGNVPGIDQTCQVFKTWQVSVTGSG
jgi:hypothetical protein